MAPHSSTLAWKIPWIDRTVHGAVQLRLLGELAAPLPRRVLVDGAGPHVGVDGHLLAGPGVEREAGRHFGDSLRALGDHHELHDGDDEEDHGAHHEVAAHHDVAERVDDLAGVRLEEDETCGRDVKREPEECRE